MFKLNLLKSVFACWSITVFKFISSFLGFCYTKLIYKIIQNILIIKTNGKLFELNYNEIN